MRNEVEESRHSGDKVRLRPEEQLARWGRWQHRQVTTSQLRAVGWDRRTVHKRVQQGRLHPVYRGVHSLGGPPRGDKELWMAAVLTYGSGTLLSHSAAVDLYGWLRYPLRDLHVTTSVRRPSRQGITAHHRARRWRWRYIDHIPVTGPEQTVLDAATTVDSDRAYRRIVRQSQVDHTNHAALLAVVAMNPGARGVQRLRHELADGPSPTRSANEDEVLEVFRHGGEPLVNHVIGGDELDLFFPGLNVAVEIDGPPHDNPTARADDEAKTERLARRGVRLLRVR